MKKIIVLFMMIMSLFGCNLSNTPTNEVEKYLDNFKKPSDDVLLDVDNVVSGEDLNSENKETYKKVLLRQYENMKYDVVDENIDGNNATVKVNVTVFDYYKTSENANTYMNEHVDEFNDVNGVFDNNLFNTYRLGELLKTNDVTTHEITFYLKKDTNGNWVLENPNKETLEKLNGFYAN